MKDFHGVLELQVETIVRRLRQMQEAKCRQLDREAEKEADELLRTTRRSLHERGHEAVNEERRRRDRALKQARHRIRAEKSHHLQVLYAGLLKDAWPGLVSELESRWASDDSRRAWSEKLVTEALAALGAGEWTIEHPVDWSAEDARWLERTLDGHGIQARTSREAGDIAAGLRIRSETACLDGTIDGLLADRPAVEGRLLAAWETLACEAHHE